MSTFLEGGSSSLGEPPFFSNGQIQLTEEIKKSGAVPYHVLFKDADISNFVGDTVTLI